MLNQDLAAAYTRAVEAEDGATLALIVQADALDRLATSLQLASELDAELAPATAPDPAPGG
jgi:hypothetical protein